MCWLHDRLLLEYCQLKLDLSLNTSQDEALDFSQDSVHLAQDISSKSNHNFHNISLLTTILGQMGWSNLLLRHGLRIEKPNPADINKIFSAVTAATAEENNLKEGLRLIELSPTLGNSERGHFNSSGRYGELEEETYDRCCEAEGCYLLYYLNSSLVLDGSNGVEIDSNRCYGGGFLEFLTGDYDVEPLTEGQTEVLKAVAEALGVEYKLSFSMTATGSGCDRASSKFE